MSSMETGSAAWLPGSRSAKNAAIRQITSARTGESFAGRTAPLRRVFDFGIV